MQPVPAIKSSKTVLGKLPANTPLTSRIACKAETGLSYALHVVWQGKSQEIEAFLIMLGSLSGHEVGFCVMEMDDARISFAELRPSFDPSPMGSRLTVGYHQVHVTAESLVAGAAKYYMIDIEVEAIARPRLLEEIVEQVEVIIEPMKKGRFRKLRHVLGRQAGESL